MTIMSNYIIIFDDQCGICNTGANVFTKLGVLKNEGVLPLSELTDSELTCHVDPQKSCDEMAIVNKQTNEIHYGVDAYGMLIAEKYPKLSKIVHNSSFKSLLKPVYAFVASNRRIIAPINTQNASCDPTLKKGYRAMLMMLMVIFSVVVTFQKGEILKHTELFGFLNGFKLLQVTVVGWVVTAFLYRKNDKWDYWGHLSIIAGSAIFIQSLALIGYHYLPHVAWVIGSMVLSDLLMMVMHYRRIKKMGHSQIYTLRWWLILHLTAMLSVAQYYVLAG